MSNLVRRQFLATAGAGVATLALAPFDVQAVQEKKGGFTLPPLPYAPDALEPVIDAETMKIHHDKHHQAYVNGLNAAIKAAPALAGKSVSELLRGINGPGSVVPAAVRQAVINMGGGHINHSIFWQIMGPKAGGKPTGPLAKAIEKSFKSFDNFQKVFSAAAATQFGSGWAWLVLNGRKELEVVKLPNQNSPYMTGLAPLLGIDVWEHAYYLKYKNERPRYINEWWKVVNWKEVATRHERFLKA